jgi:hypothetical protein
VRGAEREKARGREMEEKAKAAPQHEICARQTPFSHFPRGSPDQPTSRQSRRGKSSHFCLNKTQKITNSSFLKITAKLYLQLLIGEPECNGVNVDFFSLLTQLHQKFHASSFILVLLLVNTKRSQIYFALNKEKRSEKLQTETEYKYWKHLLFFNTFDTICHP